MAGGRRVRWLAAALTLMAAAGHAAGDAASPAASHTASHTAGPAASAVDEHAIGTFDQAPEGWLSSGRTYSEQRYSPLDKINTGNVKDIGLAFEFDLSSPRFGIEATPLVVGDTMYMTSTYSRVFAVDARTGRQRWMFDPQVPADWLINACCQPVNRGVAVWKGRLFVGALDGRLIALDAATGRKLWEVNTTGGARMYTITGAPIVADGKVIIGNGGSDYGVRGFFSAYDPDSGRLLWRFYTVPGNPKDGFETPDVALAAKSWDTKRDWSKSGDGSPWNSFSYDAETGLLYVGTGNGPWWDQPQNAGTADNLFTSSIVAVHVKTGRLAWHYQTTPGDKWDYDAAENVVLADMTIGGRPRKVLMQANKNGFYYVLDRMTGELLSADPYVYVNWANGVDMSTGRPRVVPENSDWKTGVKLLFPSPAGAHNWMGMAYSPKTRLTYIPARDIGWVMGVFPPPYFYMGYDPDKLTEDQRAEIYKRTHGVLIAWDSALKKPRWSVSQDALTNGGILTTAGDLVVQGTQDGFIRFYDANDGTLKRELSVGSGVVAPPMTYSVDGEQYVAIGVGWNGIQDRMPKPGAPAPYDNAGRLLVLKLGGGPVRMAERVTLPPFFASNETMPADQVSRGQKLYDLNCGRCHTFWGERVVYPDLRRMSQSTYDGFQAVVLGGILKTQGMASFAGVLTPDDVDSIRAYIADWARRSQGREDRPAAGPAHDHAPAVH